MAKNGADLERFGKLDLALLLLAITAMSTTRHRQPRYAALAREWRNRETRRT
jgi:hypothetical protein